MTTVLQTIISPADYMQVCAWQPSPYIPISYRFSIGHFHPIIITYRIDYHSIICHDDRPDPALKNAYGRPYAQRRPAENLFQPASRHIIYS